MGRTTVAPSVIGLSHRSLFVISLAYLNRPFYYMVGIASISSLLTASRATAVKIPTDRHGSQRGVGDEQSGPWNLEFEI